MILSIALLVSKTMAQRITTHESFNLGLPDYKAVSGFKTTVVIFLPRMIELLDRSTGNLNIYFYQLKIRFRLSYWVKKSIK